MTTKRFVPCISLEMNRDEAAVLLGHLIAWRQRVVASPGEQVPGLDILDDQIERLAFQLRVNRADAA